MRDNDRAKDNTICVRKVSEVSFANGSPNIQSSYCESKMLKLPPLARTRLSVRYTHVVCVTRKCLLSPCPKKLTLTRYFQFRCKKI